MQGRTAALHPGFSWNYVPGGCRAVVLQVHTGCPNTAVSLKGLLCSLATSLWILCTSEAENGERDL